MLLVVESLHLFSSSETEVTTSGNNMKKSLTALAATCTALTLAGCSTPPAIFAPDPVIIEHEKTLDRVHNRDASMEFYDESRGGAAVRQDMAAHVLWNEHYVADAKALAAKAEADRLAAVAKAEEEARQAALLKAKQDAEKKKAQRSTKGKDKSIYANKKDRSIYKDRSVYSNKKQAIQPKMPRVSNSDVAAKAVSQAEAEKKAKALAEAKAKIAEAKIAVRAQQMEEIQRDVQKVAKEKADESLIRMKHFEPKPQVVEALKLEPMPENPTPKPSKPGDPCCGVNPATQAPAAEATAK